LNLNVEPGIWPASPRCTGQQDVRYAHDPGKETEDRLKLRFRPDKMKIEYLYPAGELLR
jgi:hypothetical protein